MPNEIDRLADNLADHVIGVVIAVRTGKYDYAEFHFYCVLRRNGKLIACCCTTSGFDCLADQGAVAWNQQLTGIQGVQHANKKMSNYSLGPPPSLIVRFC